MVSGGQVKFQLTTLLPGLLIVNKTESGAHKLITEGLDVFVLIPMLSVISGGAGSG